MGNFTSTVLRKLRPILTRGDLLKALCWSDGGLCLLAKRLEKGRFAWPRAEGGVVALTTAQLSLLLEGFDWREPIDAARPRSAR
ncbi:IS66 family insertion sequence element accessory protein TnpB [Pandoraea sputorum]|uniref:IS66 family insertion sequence element accessory protein TnpB n=1 Tax=Pandoraea sputorum TaxID=93222 RepID=UPI001241D2B1|nr:IS66 family insertion sequence element accessory protein TnpB [Pandoraea sputorum]